MRKILQIIIFVIILASMFVKVKTERERLDVEAKIKSAHTFSKDKTNDDAVREILSNVYWSKAQKGEYTFGAYEMSVSGKTKDIEALKEYQNEVKDLYISPNADTVRIRFYFTYRAESNFSREEVRLFVAEINGRNIQYSNDGWSRYRMYPFALYDDLYRSKKMKFGEL